MMYLFYGSDTETVRSKTFAWVAAARTKEPQLLYTHLSGDSLTDSLLEEAVGAGGLFVKRLLVLIDDPFASTKKSGGDTSELAGATAQASSLIEKYIDAIVASDNAILILAPALSPALAKRIAAKATKTYCFDLRSSTKIARGFNSALVNALAARDSRKLWLEIVRALRAGDAPEMLHGLLHWKARDIMQKGARSWSATEARALSLTLIMLLGDARRTGINFTNALERFALSIESR